MTDPVEVVVDDEVPLVARMQAMRPPPRVDRDDPDDPDHISTVRGVGYRMAEP